MCPRRSIRLYVLILTVVFFAGSVCAKPKKGWKKSDVNIRMPGNTRIRGIYHPVDKPVPRLSDKGYGRAEKAAKAASADQQAADTRAVGINVIDSPPIDGFVPWISVITTSETEGELVLDAVKRPTLTPTSLSKVTTPTYQYDYAIGIFDTGASAHVMGFDAATRLGLYIDFGTEDALITDNEIEIAGVTGHISTNISYPIGLYIDGLSSIDTMGHLYTTSNMAGQSNVSIVVGQDYTLPTPDVPDLPVAIGAPLSVYYATSFKNDEPVVVTRDGKTYVAPDIKIYDHPTEPNEPPEYPVYPNILPLELRPLGGVSVQYIPDFNIEEFILDPLGTDLSFDKPATPSVIIGNLSQSVLFVHSVDLVEGSGSALDKNRFMLDTGAQVSVIGYRVAARLGLNPAAAEFTVEIQGVTGDISYYPGFYIDSIEMPCLGQWLRFTNVPVILLDISSPEGGTIDGIIGMNLFVDYNFVLKGGGIFLEDDPAILFEAIDRIVADIAPGFGDGVVNNFDLQALSSAWMSTDGDTNFNSRYDLGGSTDTPDGSIDLYDVKVLAENWLN